MNENQIGTITTIAAHGERARRIRDMGLVPGARITLKDRVR
jgi:ferrous iron transport protein A